MDSQLFAVMAGGGQSDAILRATNEDGSDTAIDFVRLFQNHPDFTYLQDLTFDLGQEAADIGLSLGGSAPTVECANSMSPTCESARTTPS